MPTLHAVSVCICLALAVLTSGCGTPASRSTHPATPPASSAPASDKPLAPFQTQLLELAFDTATLIPIYPHIKDRSAAQEKVLAACLTLDQPLRAMTWAEQIGDFRRGIVYADIAFHLARRGGDSPEVRRLIARAMDIALAEGVDDWRRDQVRVRVARVHALLGENEEAARLQTNAGEFVIGKVAQVQAMVGDATTFDAQMKELDRLVALGSFDITRNALDVYAELFDHFYSDPTRRDQIAAKVRAAWVKAPVFVRIEVLKRMVAAALKHGDRSHAKTLVEETHDLVQNSAWPAEFATRYVAEVGVLRFNAGDPVAARQAVDAAMALYEARKVAILDIDRATALRAVAEAYQAIGDSAAALTVYRRAVEEGVVNPNSRPRAEDLSATCGSMAVSGVEPDAQLWERMRKIREGLGQPW